MPHRLGPTKILELRHCSHIQNCSRILFLPFMSFLKVFSYSELKSAIRFTVQLLVNNEMTKIPLTYIKHQIIIKHTQSKFKELKYIKIEILVKLGRK